MWNFFMDIIRK